MQRTAFCLALLATLYSVPATAAKMSAEDRRDLTCLILFADVSDATKDPTEVQKIGFSSILGYFHGKIIARNAAFDLNTALTPEMLAAARASTDAVKQQCSAEASKFGDQFTAAAPKLDR